MSRPKKSRKSNSQNNSKVQVVAVGAPSNTPDDGDVFVDDINKKLSGVNGLKEFRKMKTDDKLSGVLTLIKRILLKPKWVANAFDENNSAAKANKDFLSECMNDLDHGFNNVIEEYSTIITYGFSFFEMIYKVRGGTNETDPKKRSKYSDGKIGWRDFGVRDPISLLEGGWIFDEEKNVIGVIQELDYKTVELSLEQGLLVSLDSEFRNPQGQSMLYGAYENWLFKKKIRSLMGIGIERDLAGLPVIHCPASYFDKENAERLTAMKSVVSNIRRNAVEGVVFPSSRDEKGHLKTELHLLTSGGSRQFDINKIIADLDVGMLTSLLADFMAVGHGTAGSFSLHSDKTDMFILSLEAILNKIKDALNNIEIPRLFGYNGITDNIPKVSYEPFKKEDVTALVDNIVKLSGAGMQIFPDESLDNHLRDKLDIPQSSEK